MPSEWVQIDARESRQWLHTHTDTGFRPWSTTHAKYHPHWCCDRCLVFCLGEVTQVPCRHSMTAPRLLAPWVAGLGGPACAGPLQGASRHGGNYQSLPRAGPGGRDQGGRGPASRTHIERGSLEEEPNPPPPKC
ncbi:hypothetical protein ACOMHN_017738 [Nucella lapillus]